LPKTAATLIPAIKNYISGRIFNRPVAEKKSADAYDLWSAEYDHQPGNLMLDLDEVLFSRLLDKIHIENKAIADIGCGTGRHWSKILKGKPLSLTGFDVSEGMLNKLREKFPDANVYKITDDLFKRIPNPPYDVIISTLTIAHIENLEQTLNAWCGILKTNAEIIITDFHPQMLAFGGKRTFKYKNMHLAVRNHVHHIDTIKNILAANGFRVVASDEFFIDETVKHYYDSQNASNVYEQFKGLPVIYGVYLKRGDDPE
jgi:ubiquinone/menaquinone biosynthesis C-methylase UbiE